MATVACFASFSVNKIMDAAFRAQSLGAPATYYAGLLKIQGKWTLSTAVGTTVYMVPTVGNGHLYKCTTAGTTAGTEPTWPLTAGGTVTDGTAVWTEQTTAMETGTFPAEISGGAYARVPITASLANFAGTQGAGTTVASTGNSGVTSNNAAVTWPTPTADWTPAGGIGAAAGVVVLFDASTGGNAWIYGVMNNVQTILNGNAAPSAAAGALVFGLLP